MLKDKRLKHFVFIKRSGKWEWFIRAMPEEQVLVESVFVYSDRKEVVNNAKEMIEAHRDVCFEKKPGITGMMERRYKNTGGKVIGHMLEDTMMESEWAHGRLLGLFEKEKPPLIQRLKKLIRGRSGKTR